MAMERELIKLFNHRLNQWEKICPRTKAQTGKLRPKSGPPKLYKKTFTPPVFRPIETLIEREKSLFGDESFVQSANFYHKLLTESILTKNQRF